MKTARLFRHGGSQAVRLPKAFRFDGAEVLIEKKGDAVILKPKSRPSLKTLADVARYITRKHPDAVNLSVPSRPAKHERSTPSW